MKHKWKGQQLGGNPANESSYEWVCYCDECGAERTDDNVDEECQENDLLIGKRND